MTTRLHHSASQISSKWKQKTSLYRRMDEMRIKKQMERKKKVRQLKDITVPFIGSVWSICQQPVPLSAFPPGLRRPLPFVRSPPHPLFWQLSLGEGIGSAGSGERGGASAHGLLTLGSRKPMQHDIAGKPENYSVQARGCWRHAGASDKTCE